MKLRHKRLAIIGGVVASVAVAAGLVLNAFQSNLVFFYSPSQVVATAIQSARLRAAPARGRALSTSATAKRHCVQPRPVL